MKTLLISPLLFLLLLIPSQSFTPLAYAEDVALIRGSYHIKVHDEAVEGFKDVYKGGIKEFEVGKESRAKVNGSILALKPKLILAVGYEALYSVMDIPDIPVVFAMILNPENLIPAGRPLTGVDMSLPVERQLDELQRVLHRVKRIGIIYDPDETGNIFRDAEKAASERGLIVSSQQVQDSAEVIEALNYLRGRIDVLWLLPDVTVITQETFKHMASFSHDARIPIFAISEKYVEAGALMASSIDAYDIGRQAGEIANRILAGEPVENIPIVHARKGELSLNLSVAEKLGITIPPDVIKRAAKIY